MENLDNTYGWRGATFAGNNPEICTSVVLLLSFWLHPKKLKLS